MKEYKKQFKALQNIQGVVIKGNVYDYEDMKKLFPYIDFTNEEYFEEYIDPSIAKFTKNTMVKYIGNSFKIRKKEMYIITAIEPYIKYGKLDVRYTIEPANGRKFKFMVNEKDIEKIDKMWVVSFSNNRLQGIPSVHELDYFSWESKVQKSWKNMFVFKNIDDAKKIATMFATHSITDIYDAVLYMDAMNDAEEQTKQHYNQHTSS